MRTSNSSRLSTCHTVDSYLPTHTKFTTKQKAKIGKCLEIVNSYLFECYDEPAKVYKLTDVYRVLRVIVDDGNAKDIDEAINIFMERLK